MQNSRLEDISH